MLGEQPLQVGLCAILDQTGVRAELMGRVCQTVGMDVCAVAPAGSIGCPPCDWL